LSNYFFILIALFGFKKQSEQFLEIAKRAVEIAIEQDEISAIEFINSYMD